MRKNSKKLSAILNNPEVAGTKYTLENSFRGEPISGQNLRNWFLKWYDSLNVSETRDGVCLTFHSNCWVEIPTVQP
jgi:hypothetical protein